MDDQVKVRGFLVEPAEVERRLGELPGVRRAAVVAVEEPGGGHRLAAFVVCEPEATAGGGELRAGLRMALPDFMVPASVSIVDDLPVESGRQAGPPGAARALYPGSGAASARP